MNFRYYLSLMVLIILLIWGPIDHTWPAWLAIRLGYLILIPAVLWFLLRWIWNSWQPDRSTERTLERILFGIISLGFIVFGVLEATSKTHMVNTHWIQTHDGAEAVGDDIVVPGPDYGAAFILTVIGIILFWLCVIAKGKNSYVTKK